MSYSEFISALSEAFYCGIMDYCYDERVDMVAGTQACMGWGYL